MRRRRPRAPAPPEPPAHIRRFVAAEWGWDGPQHEDGHTTLGHYEAERRYLDAWGAWMDESGCGLIDWFDRFEGLGR